MRLPQEAPILKAEDRGRMRGYARVLLFQEDPGREDFVAGPLVPGGLPFRRPGGGNRPGFAIVKAEN